MDSIRGNAGLAPAAPTPGPVFGPPVGDDGEKPPAPKGDRVSVSPDEKEPDKGSIPNFGAAFGAEDPKAPKGPDGKVESASEKAGREKDEEMMRHVCGSGCGCISTGPGSGQDVSKVFESRDQEVRQHEQEHLSTAGEHAKGGPTFETYTASNGKTYVTGGKVEVDLGEAGDPRKTADKMAKIRKAALAPKSPSSQDRSVEAEAAGKEAEARRQMQADEIKGVAA
ncbi:MAG: putative metalloprotease CJM1_0395 family protein [Candidatus Eremiobacterota bacterium]